MRAADEASGVGPGGTRWECLRCGQGVAGADRLGAVVEEVESEYGSEGNMSFEFGSEDLEFSDMTGSVDDGESVESE